MKNYHIWLNNKIRPLNFSCYSKKGRKNSTPNATFTVTFSPDGACTSLLRFNLG
jgi:hypothetical protein